MGTSSSRPSRHDLSAADIDQRITELHGLLKDAKLARADLAALRDEVRTEFEQFKQAFAALLQLWASSATEGAARVLAEVVREEMGTIHQGIAAIREQVAADLTMDPASRVHMMQTLTTGTMPAGAHILGQRVTRTERPTKGKRT